MADVREDLKRNREEDKQLHLELVRDVRLKTRTIHRELEETQEDLLEKVKANDMLVTAVSKGTGQLRSLRVGGLRWKTKFLASQDDVKGKTRQIRKDLAKTQQDLLQTKGTNVVLVEEVIFFISDDVSFFRCNELGNAYLRPFHNVCPFFFNQS